MPKKQDNRQPHDKSDCLQARSMDPKSVRLPKIRRPGGLTRWLATRLAVTALFACLPASLLAWQTGEAPVTLERLPPADGASRDVPSVNTEPVSAGESLEVQQVMGLAINNDPVFQQINWAIEKARGERRQATRYPNPVVGITTNEIGNEGAAGQYGVFWSQNLVRNQRQRIQHRYFSIVIAALQQQYDVRRWQLSRSVGTRILNIARYEEQIRITARQIAGLEEIMEFTRQLFQAGEISKIVLTNIELGIDRLRQESRELEIRRQFEQRTLAIRLGWPVGDAAAADPGWPEIVFDWQQTIDQLMNDPLLTADAAWLSNHPQIQYAWAEVRQSRIEIELARAQQCPDVQVQASLNFDDATDDVFGGFQVGIPILTQDRKYGVIAAASAEYQRRVEAVRLQEMQLQSLWTLNAGELSRLRSRVANMRDVIIPKAEENLQQIRSAWAVGEAEFLLLRTGLETLLDAQIRLLDAEYELAVASIRLNTLLLDEVEPLP
jgi:outer membrane protein TolC